MKVVFLDTVGLIALWNASDQWHRAAARAYRSIQRTYQGVITTPYVFLECGNLATKTAFRSEVNALRQILQARQEIVEPTAAEVEQAWVAFDRYEAAGAGIVDQISFQVMRRLRVRDAFSNDRHFQAAGFVTLF